MWRQFSISMVLLLACMAHAQAGRMTSDKPRHGAGSIQEPSLAKQPPFVARGIVVSAYQRYDSLRRGQEQEMQVMLCTAHESFPYCQFGSVLNQETLVPLVLEANSSPGFTIFYRQGNEYRVQTQGTPVLTGGRKVFLLKIHASDNVPLGAHVLEGRLRFLQGDQGPGGVWAGNGVVQEIAVKIPVTVAAKDAQVAEAWDWPASIDAGPKPVQVAKEAFTWVRVLGVTWFLCLGGCDTSAFSGLATR